MDLSHLLKDAEEGQWDFAPAVHPVELQLLVRRIVREDLRRSDDSTEFPIPAVGTGASLS